MELPARQLGQQLRRLLAFAGPKFCECGQRELRFQQGDSLPFRDVPGEPAQRRALELGRLLLGVEKEQPQRLVEGELPELSSRCLGSHEVALLYGALEVGTEGSDL
jgi:hypothetical protein